MKHDKSYLSDLLNNEEERLEGISEEFESHRLFHELVFIQGKLIGMITAALIYIQKDVSSRFIGGKKNTETVLYDDASDFHEVHTPRNCGIVTR